MLSVLTELLVP